MVDQPGRPKTLNEIKEYLLDRTIKQRNPMDGAREEDVRHALDQLTEMDADLWAQVWSNEAKHYEEQAEEAEANEASKLIHESRMLAYQYYRLARFPCPNTPAKQIAAERGIQNYLAASPYFKPAHQTVEIPFDGKPGEGTSVRAYLRLPPGVERPPVLVQHGGIDSFKEERHRYVAPLLDRGIASLSIDMPGTGESPVKGALDGERVYQAVLDWIEQRGDIVGNRVGLIGGSFGGYWVSKAAHVFHDRFAGVVNWGGGIHYGFQNDWIKASRFAGSYLTDLIETRAHAFGLTSYDEWVEFAPKLSLLDQGLLDGPHAPMLLINGKDDAQTPIADLYLLLEHGGAKTARVFPGGHMGQTPQTYPTIVDWMAQHLLTTRD